MRPAELCREHKRTHLQAEPAPELGRGLAQALPGQQSHLRALAAAQPVQQRAERLGLLARRLRRRPGRSAAGAVAQGTAPSCRVHACMHAGCSRHDACACVITGGGPCIMDAPMTDPTLRAASACVRSVLLGDRHPDSTPSSCSACPFMTAVGVSSQLWDRSLVLRPWHWLVCVGLQVDRLLQLLHAPTAKRVIGKRAFQPRRQSAGHERTGMG